MNTMLKSTVLLLFSISWGLANGGGLDLPHYIPKCSLSHPKLCKCLVEKANKVIPIITKGDAYHNIPSMFPIIYSEAAMVGTDLTYVLYHAISYNWIKLVITEMVIDLESGKLTFVGHLDKLQVLGQNYTITKGKALDIPVYGHGRYNSTFVGLKINYSGRIRFYKKGEDVYLDYFDSRADSSCEWADFHFENLQTTAKCDVHTYIKENWKKFYIQTKPAFDGYFNAFVNYLLQPIVNSVPFKKIFLP